MGEEEKKPEEEAKKPQEEKKVEEKAEKPKEEKKADKPNEPPPPEEIILRVFMHCEGCAKKVKRCLNGFEGVEDVQTDCRTHKVVVKGKSADPLKVLERVQRKSHRQVELLSPIPKPPAEKKKSDDDKAEPKPEEKKEEVITAVLKVHMHCEGCAQGIRKRIQRMKGVEAADPDLKSSQVTVKGIFDPAKLVEYVNKRTGKHAVIVKQEPEKKEEEKGKKEKEEKKEEGGEKEKKETKEGQETKATEEEAKVEVKKNEFNYFPPKYAMEFGYAPHIFNEPPQIYNYAPQIFSDENPNACSVM